MGLGDVDKTAKFRDIVRRLIRSEVDLIRPRPKYGLVLSHNVIARRAMVLFNGDTEPTEVIAPNGLQPATSEEQPGETHGCIVKVQGTAGNYWISEVVKGAELHSSPNLLRPTLRGGTFGQDRMSTFFGYNVAQPAIGNAMNFGRWETTHDLNLDHQGMLRVMVTLPPLTTGSVAIVKMYEFPIFTSSSGGSFRRALPIYNTGASGGNDFNLEVAGSVDRIRLRIRKISGGAIGDYRVWMWANVNWIEEVENDQAGETSSTTSILYEQQARTFAPNLYSAGGAINLGSTGSISGWWARDGLFITGGITFLFGGTGIVVGSSTYYVDLPWPADTQLQIANSTTAQSTVIGSAQVRQNPLSGSMVAVAALDSATRMRFQTDAGNISSASPSSWGDSEGVTAQFRYLASPN